MIVEGIQDHLDQSKSPVSGGRFKRLLKDGTPSLLFEEGDLRSAIVSKNRKGDEIEVGVFKSSELKKAYNHNIGDTLPVRQFIPDVDQNFKNKIVEPAKRKIEELKGGERANNQRTLSSLLDEAFESAVIESESTGSGIGLTIGNLLENLDG